jgi:presenilin-like A22 family membrane protease
MMPQYRSRWMVLAIFLLAGAITIAAVFAVRQHQLLAYPTVVRWQYAFLALALAGSLVALIRRVRSRLFWEIFLTLAVFLGTWYLCLLVMPLGPALLVASAMTLAEWIAKNVAIHDAFIVFGAVGVAIDFAGWLTPEFLLLGLVLLTVYDMLAGPPGGPIEELASHLVKHGIVPGVIVVNRWKDLGVSLVQAIRGDAALVGAGDLVLPLSLVARAAFHGAGSAAIVLAGVLVGAFVLTHRDDTHPRAALPALAVGAAVPFIVLRLLGLV